MLVSGWLDDETILLSSAHAAIHGIDASMYSLSLDGTNCGRRGRAPRHRPRRTVGPVVVATSNFRDPSGWKRYRGGMAARLYTSPDGTSDWKRVLPAETAGLFSPTWVGERIVFTSDLGDDPQVQAQVWSVNASAWTSAGTRRTAPPTATSVMPPAHAKVVVYHARGDLYQLASLKAEPQKLDIYVPVGRPRPVPVAPNEHLEQIVPDQGGDGSLLEWRGAAYFLTHRGSPARALADTAGVRVREPRFLDDKGRVVWVSDVAGEDCLEIRQVDGGDKTPRRIATGRLGRVLALQSSPTGAKIAVWQTMHRLARRRGPRLREEDRPVPGRRALWFALSPDGRYIVWRSALAHEGALGQLVGYDVTGEQAFTLTKGQFNDFSPTFTPDGKHLCFLSSRTIDPTYDELAFDLSFTNSVRPWLVPLSAAEPAPFGPAADGWPISEPADKDDDKATDDKPAEGEAAGGEAKEVEPGIEFDVEGFEDRMVAFPVPSGRYGSLAATKEGLIWRSYKSIGELGAGRAGVDGEVRISSSTSRSGPASSPCWSAPPTAPPSQTANAWSCATVTRCGCSRPTSLPTTMTPRCTSTCRGCVARSIRSPSGGRCSRRTRGSCATTTGATTSTARTGTPPSPATGPCWARSRRTHSDLVDVLWETVGELNTSHAYVSAPPLLDDAPRVGFLLGRRSTRATPRGGWSCAASSPARAPIRAPGRRCGPQASPSRPVTSSSPSTAVRRTRPPTSARSCSGRPTRAVEPTVARGRQKRRVAVVPTANEAPMRYHEWVAGRVAYVAEHGEGRRAMCTCPTWSPAAGLSSSG